MSRIRIVTAVAAIALSAAGAVIAQTVDAAAPADDPQATRSVADLEQRVRERTAAADADRDGFITAQELQAQREAKHAEWAQRRLARLDADGDGKVSTAEYEAGHIEKVARLDADGDGNISREEMRGARRHGRFSHGDGGFHDED